MNNLTGSIILGFGCHEIVVATGITPSVVVVDEEPIGIQVCGGCDNSIAAEIIPGGFSIHAEIHSNTAEVSWVAE